MQRHVFEANVKSARRLRQGMTTLWLSYAIVETGDASGLDTQVYCRSLLYVP